MCFHRATAFTPSAVYQLTTEPAFTALLETVPVPLPWMPLSPGCSSLHPALLGDSESAVYVVSLTQPHLESRPAQPPLETVCQHTLQIQTRQLLHSGGRCPQGLLLCLSPLRVPFQPLLSHLPAPGTLCSSRREAQTGCPICWQAVFGHLSFSSHWTCGEDGSPGLGRLVSVHSATPLSSSHHLPDSIESIVQERYFGNTFFFLSVGARV